MFKFALLYKFAIHIIVPLIV